MFLLEDGREALRRDGDSHEQQTVPETGAVRMGEMRVVVPVTVLMVAAMERDPAKQRSFDGHRAQHGERRVHDAAGCEGAVSEEPMVPDRYAKTACDVHSDEQSQVQPIEAVTPDQHHRPDEAGERDENDDEACDSVL